MKSLLKIMAAAMLAVGLTAGVAAAGTGTIDTTGADSNNEIKFEDNVESTVDATNDTTGSVDVDQDAETGDANVNKNTNAGDADSGDAENDSEVAVSVESSNEGAAGSAGDCGCPGDSEAEIMDTGYNSNNVIEFNNEYTSEVTVENTTDLEVSVNQNATSGNANANMNTNGGGASTGDATNTSSTHVDISSMN